MVVDRRVVTEPEHVGILARGFRVGGEAQRLLRQKLHYEFIQLRLEDGRTAISQAADSGLIEIHPDGLEVFSAAGSSDGAEMPESKNGDMELMSAIHCQSNPRSLGIIRRNV